MGMKNNERYLASKSPKPATVVFDKGRRGNPLPGCDCVQCFGYCMIDGDQRQRLLVGKVETKEDKQT